MLQKYNGAILADAVGLGKTWSALAVIKFFQLQGRETILLCPKKIENNWRHYKKNQDSKFEKDQFDFFIRFHTDMNEDRLETYNDRADKFFKNDKPKLIVIDESHNLRNDKSNRYKFLLEEILKSNEDIKVLLLSATPINNSLNDIRNQFKLMIKGNVNGYEENLGVRNIDYSFRTAQREFNKWREEDNPKIGDFIKKIPSDFFTLTDSLIVARTRKMIEGQQEELVFPIKERPVNLYVTPHQFGNFESFEELFDHFPPMLSGYQPSLYLEEEENSDVLHDEKQRDHFLVKMLYILMVKRLESSWSSFYSTVQRIKLHHQNVLNMIRNYQEQKKNSSIGNEGSVLFNEDEFESDFEDEFNLGKKRKISIAEIDKAKSLETYKKDLKRDLDSLENLCANLYKFNNKLKDEVVQINNQKSSDSKLEKLIDQINLKQKNTKNNDNKKIIIFTVYHDTAKYLFEQLRSRGFDKLALVSGSGAKTSDSDVETKKIEPILERFAPYTKLFKGKEWGFTSNKNDVDSYKEWISWVNKESKKTYEQLQNPIDILIATDVLSEGQNLQDADMVINYDIHWNPVRIIQRMGRIDRLGSPNKRIFGVNFWPSENINSYLNLQGRVEQRMAMMKLGGAELDDEFSESFKRISHDESLDRRMSARMMRQMETTWDDIEVSDQGFGFNDLSLESYRQDLLEEFNKDKEKYQLMPKGVYTGFKADPDVCAKEGMIALLGYPAKPTNKSDHEYKVFDLIYIDKSGELVLLNQKEVLDAITLHKDNNRDVPAGVDAGEKQSIDKLVFSLQSWLNNQTHELRIQDDGTTKKTMGKETKDMLEKLRRGNKDALEKAKSNIKPSDKYKLENFDLIAWFLVSL
jgi:superfamily II DNA/RNA helicase